MRGAFYTTESTNFMEKIKLYLDTNMLIDLFINQAKTHKSGLAFEEPSKFKFMVENLEKFQFITSFLTKAEIMREMTAGHNMDPGKINELWSDLMGTLQADFVDRFEFGPEIIDVVAQVKMKLRTMFNYEHLFIAMARHAYIVSGDKPFLEKVRQTKLYDKVLTYIELRKLASSL